MQRDLIAAFVLFLLFTALTGVVYPGVVTGVAQLGFREQANGSLIVRDGKPVGSALIGQPFSDPKYFWSRPSATTPQPYNALASSGSNLGPRSAALFEAVKQRLDALRRVDPENATAVPADLVTASASGLDPHISRAAAEFQVQRAARARGLDEARLRKLVAAHTEPRTLGVLCEARVNVLQLNLALDASAR